MFLSKQLNLFIAMAEENSYQRTADRLFLTVPPVFKMLKEIESWAGFKLFENINGVFSMTREGQELYDTLHPIHTELKNLKIKQTYKTKMISLTSDSINSDIVADLSFHLIKDNINFINIKNEKNRLLGSDIHISTTKKNHDNNITEIKLEEKMMIWNLKNKESNLSNTLLAQDNSFYQSEFYHTIINNLQEMGYKKNGIIIDNPQVRKAMVIQGTVVSIDNLSWGKDLKDLSHTVIPQEKEIFIYIRNNILNDVTTSLNNFVLLRQKKGIF